MMSSEPGGLLRREIGEQGDVVARVIGTAMHRDLSTLLDRPRILLTGRGSSGAAALYGAAALTLFSGREAHDVSPSLLGFHKPMIDLKDTVLLGISQSGASSEVIEAAAWARSRGAKVVALTNFPDAPLTEGLPVDQVLLMDAGEEQAVPATKTFTASLAWLLALTLVPHLERLRNLQGCMERRLNHDHQADVRSLAGATSFYFVGEGVTASLAREGALKFREMLSVASISLETSDLLHGSVAALDERSAVIGLAADGVGTSVLQQARRAWEARGARCLCFTSEDDPEDKADLGGSLAPAFPLLAALSLQKIALGLALHAGIDPDRPIGLEKVTETVVPKLASHGE